MEQAGPNRVEQSGAERGWEKGLERWRSRGRREQCMQNMALSDPRTREEQDNLTTGPHFCKKATCPSFCSRLLWERNEGEIKPRECWGRNRAPTNIKDCSFTHRNRTMTRHPSQSACPDLSQMTRACHHPLSLLAGAVFMHPLRGAQMCQSRRQGLDLQAQVSLKGAGSWDEPWSAFWQVNQRQAF